MRAKIKLVLGQMEGSNDVSIGIVFERTIDLVQDLRVAEVDSQWIEDVTAGNFCEINGLPSNLNENANERNFFISTLRELNKVSRNWIEVEDKNSEFNILMLLTFDQVAHHLIFCHQICSYGTSCFDSRAYRVWPFSVRSRVGTRKSQARTCALGSRCAL